MMVVGFGYKGQSLAGRNYDWDDGRGWSREVDIDAFMHKFMKASEDH